MGRFAPLIMAALAITPAAADGVQTCIQTCANQLRSEFTKFACQNADDAACLCAKDNFSYGVRDCGAHCGANDDNVRQFLLGSFCAGVFATQTTQAKAPVTSSAATASATEKSEATTGTSATSQSPSTSMAPTTTQESTTSTTDSSTSSAAVASTTPTSTSATSSAATEEPASATSTAAAAAANDSTAGTSQASVIGIGVGVGAAVVALAGIVICLLLRSRKKAQRHSMEISKPLPGSGRAYAGRERVSYEKHDNDIEMTSHRYEDMVPRQQPRTMV